MPQQRPWVSRTSAANAAFSKLSCSRKGCIPYAETVKFFAKRTKSQAAWTRDSEGIRKEGGMMGINHYLCMSQLKMPLYAT